MSLASDRKLPSWWLAGLFVAAIFIGDVWLVKLTLPVSMLVLPFLFLRRDQLSIRLPPAAIPLLSLGAIIGLQFASNFWNPAFRWKSDLAVWLPLVFGGVTVIAIRPWTLSDARARQAMIVGGAITSGIMLGMMVFAPKGLFIVPGQDATHVEAIYAGERAQSAARAETPILAPVAPVAPARPVKGTAAPATAQPSSPAVATPAGREAFATEMQQGDQAFYNLKNRARNALGLSNYIAVFLLFLFAVTLFSGAPLLATAFAICTVLTLSRFGIAFLAIVWAVYFLRSRFRPINAALVWSAMVAAGLVVAYVFRSDLANIPGITSVTIRFEYWRSGIVALLDHPLFGAPRSVFLVELGNSVTWNPHNSVLWVAVNFGLIGLAAYLAYVGIVMREVAKAAETSPLFTGAFVGLALVLVWSLVEIIALTPAFEILMAATYSLALNRNRMALA
ncbi:O-antigen ligase [Mesorhizobium sp. M7A.F.Ca.MR.362.00.0.0]|uniref:O-antigen ligase family protein n=1 Tax=Mesorhizobium sp. M7A.F.Ca.MR.362.00.0.0 TaxID=2496779 RepID=UPI000FD2DA97|nr:O-antigen ligase family protein [Mesorhizobium sp. M7A.F.Ca.MR.362.00.0.0]RUU81291.1 O-antigen ligase domain-containing protein [Mesorhizobium sp. M7A.F.Ca.MR.362.00.0.0]